MYRRHLLALGAAASVAGCAGFLGGEKPGQLALTVQNERPTPVTAQVRVVDGDDTVYLEESDRIDGDVARSFDVDVGTDGRHEVIVSGDDWRGQLAWSVDTCALFDATVKVTPDSVEVAGECVQPR